MTSRFFLTIAIAFSMMFNSISATTVWADEIAEETKATFTIKFNLNGGNSENIIEDIKVAENPSIITLPASDGISRQGYEFRGWSTTKDKPFAVYNQKLVGTIYAPESNIEISDSEYSEETTFYAVWAQTEGVSKATIRVSIRTDGKIPTEPSTHPSSEYTRVAEKKNVNILDYVNCLITTVGAENVSGMLTEQFYDEFNPFNVSAIQKKGWNPETHYVEWYVCKYQSAGATWHINGVMRNRQRINVDYNPNCVDYTGLYPDGNQYNCNETVIVEGPCTMARSGYSFLGWNTEADGTGTSYNENDTMVLEDTSVILYAQWKLNKEETIVDEETVSENEVESVSDDDIETPSENEAETVSDDDIETPSENEVEAVSDDDIETPSENEVESVSDNDAEASSENEEDTVVEDTDDVVLEDEEETQSENEMEPISEDSDETPEETEEEVISDDVIETPEETEEVISDDVIETPTEAEEEVISNDVIETPAKAEEETISNNDAEAPSKNEAKSVSADNSNSSSENKKTDDDKNAVKPVDENKDSIDGPVVEPNPEKDETHNDTNTKERAFEMGVEPVVSELGNLNNTKAKKSNKKSSNNNKSVTETKNSVVNPTNIKENDLTIETTQNDVPTNTTRTIPQTGDNNDVVTPIIMMIFGIVVFIISLKNYKKSK